MTAVVPGFVKGGWVWVFVIRKEEVRLIGLGS
jgi:hypothetical protein